MIKTCPFAFMFRADRNCPEGGGETYSGCQAWNDRLNGCALLLPFLELAEDIIEERMERKKDMDEVFDDKQD